MHRYMRAIGFSKKMSHKEILALCSNVEARPDEKVLWSKPEEAGIFAQMEMDIDSCMGVCIRGEYNDENKFVREYYFPYLKGTGINLFEQVSVERHAEKDSYAGICEDMQLGMNLIFYLQNAAEYMKKNPKNAVKGQMCNVSLSGLSVDGKILLPVERKGKAGVQPAKAEHAKLLYKARQGDEEAMEDLALEDMDLYSMIHRRVAREDVYSIVDTSFMPCGIECDQYAVVGEIHGVRTARNHITGDSIYLLTIDCNDLTFDVAINSQDLQGEPMTGRRFKGTIWLQGYVEAI